MHTCFLSTTAAWCSAWMQNAIASLNDNFCKWPWSKWNVKRWVLLQDKWSQGALSDQEIHMWLDSLNELIRKSFLTYLSIVAITVLDSMSFHGIGDSSVYIAKFETITTSTRLGWSGTHIWLSLNVIYAELFFGLQKPTSRNLANDHFSRQPLNPSQLQCGLLVHTIAPHQGLPVFQASWALFCVASCTQKVWYYKPWLRAIRRLIYSGLLRVCSFVNSKECPT